MNNLYQLYQYINSYSEITTRRKEQLKTESVVDDMLSSCNRHVQLDYFRTVRKYNRKVSSEVYQMETASAVPIIMNELNRVDLVHKVLERRQSICGDVLLLNKVLKDQLRAA